MSHEQAPSPQHQERQRLQSEHGIKLPSLDIEQGWFPLVERFLRAVHEAGEQDPIRVLQIKEKFGGLRIYHDGSRELLKLAHELEEESYQTCEECGQPGELRKFGELWATRCDDCARQLEERRRHR